MQHITFVLVNPNDNAENKLSKEDRLVRQSASERGRNREMTILKEGLVLTRRGFLANVLFFFVYFTTYFIFAYYLSEQILAPAGFNPHVAQAALNFAMAIVLATMGFLLKNVNPVRAMYAFSTAGAASMILLFLAPGSVLSVIALFVVGAFLAFGELAFFIYFWKTTAPEERARIGGLVGLVTLPFYFGAIAVAPSLDLEGVTLLSMSLVLITFSAALLKPGKALLRVGAGTESTPEKRTIILYTIPWIVFSLVNATLAPSTTAGISQINPSLYETLVLAQLFSTFGGVLLCGFMADILGRRPALALALTLYGFSSALPGLFDNEAAFVVAHVANGVGWGFLLILYGFVIWGDLSNRKNFTQMYSIGLIILYVGEGIGFLAADTQQLPLIVSSLASSLLIFLSNMPILVAPELSPTDFRERLRLKMHLNAVKKVKRQKATQT
jgi:predicted MFS family arabinose efflux permease